GASTLGKWGRFLLSPACSGVQEAPLAPCPGHTPGAGPAAILSPRPSHFAASGRADPGDAPGTARLVPAGGPIGPPAVSAAAARWSWGAPRVYTEEALLLLALLRTLWRLSYRELHHWLVAWAAPALACGLV